MSWLKEKATFPSEYFDYPNKKPAVQVPGLQGTLLDLEALVFAKVTAGTVEEEEACCYLWQVFEQIDGILKEDWTSFGTTIGMKGAKVCVRDILQAETLADKFIVATAGQGGHKESSRLYILLLLLAPYKIHHQVSEGRKRMLSRAYDDKIRSVMPGGCRMLSFEFIGTRGVWEQRPNYSTMVAGLDMFLNMFPEHPYAMLRIGTETSRFKGCVALEDLKYLETLTGETLPDALMWIWTPRVASDINKIRKEGEEVGCPNSYAPYVSSMHLARRSPYSAQENDYLHMFVHTVGCIMGVERSFNVPVIEIAWGLIESSWVMGYALSTSARDMCQDQAEKEKEPRSSDPMEWLAYIKKATHPYRILPKHLELAVCRKLITNAGLRPKTVGMHLKEEAQRFLQSKGHPV